MESNSDFTDEDTDSDSGESITSRKRTVEQLLGTVPEYIQKVQCDTQQWTPPFKCAITSCPNMFVNYEQRDSLPYKFHNFPTVTQLRTQWKQLCNLPADADLTHIKVCSDHFSLDDYIRNYKEEFINPLFKRKLKPEAVPNCNLTGNPVEITFDVPIPNLEDVKQAVDEREMLEERIKAAETEIAELKATVKFCYEKTACKRRDIMKMKSMLRQVGFKINTVKQEKNLIHKVFSEAQVKLLLGKKKVFWTDDDLAKAFTMRHMGGKPCYLYLKNVLKYPLPSLSCVQRWIASNKFEI